ncbi:MAG: metallophosphoesterase family protein, partial [Bacteroidia bacterium]|nr:metallophosphoesterase family protein [Bacteroidia bacterium]
MKNRLIGSIILCLCMLSGFADTDKYRIILTDDPATTITIAWNQGALGINPVVYYDVTDHGTDHTLYAFSKTQDRAVVYKGMDNRFVRLSGLTPNTNYYFIIKDSQSTSQRFWFRTAPSDNSRLSFISGGDSRNNRSPRQNANLLVSKLKPHAVLFGGDMTDDDTNSEWQDWFDDWQLTTASDGRMFPIVPARGNHEYDPLTIYNLFDTYRDGLPSSDAYYAITFGNNLIRTYTLNSEISVLGNQLTWLQNDLAASTNLTWKMAQYHKPMRPHTSGKSEGNSEYSAWSQLFYDEEVRLVVECDSHMSKTTYPIMPSSASGNDEGFIQEPLFGTVYTGEGCWGAPLRPNDDLKDWTRNSGSFNQFKLIFVDTEKIELRTIKVNNASSVGENSNTDPFTLPTNLDVFTPSPGEDVVNIYKVPPCTITDLTVGSQGACNSADDTYTQDVVVSYYNAPTTGSLEVNGQLFPIEFSEFLEIKQQTVTLTNLDANGLDVNVSANFTVDLNCVFTKNILFEAPSKCSTGGVPDNTVDETISLALLSEATVSGNVTNGRGIPEHILFDPSTNDYAIPSNYNEYGVAFGENLGTPTADEGMKWQVNWPNNKSFNYLTFGGVYSDQPQPNTMWRISYRNAGVWTVLEQGQGGWLDAGIYAWGGPAETPIIADAIRIQLYSDGSNNVSSIHLRGRGGISSTAGDDTDTVPKATVIQYLSLQESCDIPSIPANTQLYCYDKWQNGNGMSSTTASENFIISNGTVTINVDENVEVNDLEVLSDATIIVKEGGSLTINGELDLEGNLELQSTSTKYSSLIVDNVTGTGQVEYNRWVNPQSNRNDLIAPMFNTQTWSSFLDDNSSLIVSNGSGPTQYLFGPFEKGTTDNYIIYDSAMNPNLVAGKGYRAASVGSGNTLKFRGDIVAMNEAFKIDIVNDITGDFPEWNLIGNPYPSYINMYAFLNHEVAPGLTNINLFDPNSAAIYGYDGDVSDGYWTTYNLANSANKLIAPGQGFFVSADASKTALYDLEFAPEMRKIVDPIDEDFDDFIVGRAALANLGNLKLKIQNNTNNFVTDFYFNTNGSLGLDPGYDAAMFGGSAPA